MGEKSMERAHQLAKKFSFLVIGAMLATTIACSEDENMGLAAKPEIAAAKQVDGGPSKTAEADDKAKSANIARPVGAEKEIPKYELRGATLPVGTVVSSTFKAEVGRAKSTLAATQLLQGTYTYRHETKSEFEVNRVDSEGAITQVTESLFIKRKLSTIDFGSIADQADWNGPLQGEVVIHEYKDNSWQTRLYGKDPNPDQKVALAKPFKPAGDLFPNSKVGIGEKWKVRSENFHMVLDTDPGDKISGELTLTLAEVKDVEGKMQAFITGQCDVTATSMDGAQTAYKMTGKITRELNPGFTSSMEWSGKFHEKVVRKIGKSDRGIMITEGKIKLVTTRSK
jgi:hypothetical protein